MSITDLAKYQTIELDKLVKAVWNYKLEDEALTEKLIENMKRNGQIENIIVRELETGFYEVVNGNHRYEALKALESKEVIAYNLGKITLQEAQRIAIETNETKFQTDQIKLAGVIGELSNVFTADDLVKTLPFSQQEIDNFLQMNSYDPNSFAKPSGDSSGEAGARTHDPSVIHIKMSDDLKEQWEKWKQLLQGQSGIDANDYNAFTYAVEAAIQDAESYGVNFKGVVKQQEESK